MALGPGVLRADPVEERNGRPLRRRLDREDPVALAQPRADLVLHAGVDGLEGGAHGICPLLDVRGRRRRGRAAARPAGRLGGGSRVGGSVGSVGTRASSCAAASVSETTVEP